VLVFLDESYEADDAGGLRHAYAGFGIDELQYRRLMAAVHQAKLRYFKQAGAMASEEIHATRATHIVTELAPEDAEIKATKLMTAKQANWHATHRNAPGILMVTDVLDSVASCDSTVFAVLSNPSDLRELRDREGHLPIQFCRLLERVESWMREEHPDRAAVIVPDTVHEGIDRQLSKRIADFLFRSDQGKRMRHLVPSPFWVDSHSTAGSQVADIIAHILMNGMRPASERKALDDLWRRVVSLEYRSVDGRTRGIRRVRKQQTGAEAH
jgi:hypothetical protein